MILVVECDTICVPNIISCMENIIMGIAAAMLKISFSLNPLSGSSLPSGVLYPNLFMAARSSAWDITDWSNSTSAFCEAKFTFAFATPLSFVRAPYIFRAHPVQCIPVICIAAFCIRVV